MDTPQLNATASQEELARAIERFTNHCYGRLGLAPKTIELNVGIMRRWAREIGVDPTTEQMENYIAKIRRGGKTNTYARAIAVNFQHYSKMLGRDLVLGKPRKQKGLVMNVLSEAEIAVLISHSKDLRERAMLLVLAYGGIRNEELCNLRIRDVDIANQSLRIIKTKNDDNRVSCVSGPCMDGLIEYLQARKGTPSDFLFVTRRKGNQLATQDVRKIIRVAAQRAGITKRVHPHLFRHSLATNLLHRGAGLLSIQEQLGHRNLAATLLYLHTNKDRLQADYRKFCPSYV